MAIGSRPVFGSFNVKPLSQNGTNHTKTANQQATHRVNGTGKL